MILNLALPAPTDPPNSSQRALGEFAQPTDFIDRNSASHFNSAFRLYSAPAPCSDLIRTQIYACVAGQGGRIHGQTTETERKNPA